MTFRIEPFDSVPVVSTGSAAYLIPTTTISDFTSRTSAPMLLNVYNTGSAIIYIQASGSAKTGDARYLLTGEQGTYGPVSADNFPQLRFDGVGGCWVSFDLWGGGI